MGGLHVVIDRVVEHDVTDSDAATMFAWNLPTVRRAHEPAARRETPEVRSSEVDAAAGLESPESTTVESATAVLDWLPSPAALDALQQALDDIAYMPLPTSRIRWGLRQVALRLE